MNAASSVSLDGLTIAQMNQRDWTDEAVLPSAALAALEAVPDGVMIVDQEVRIVFASEQACELFGYAVEDLVGSEVHVLVPGTADQAHRGHTARFLAHPQRRSMGEHTGQLAGRRRDGTEFPVEISLSPLEHGGRSLVIASVRDISSRVRFEADAMAIQQSLDKVADATILFDAETIEILHVNEGALHQSGYSRAALLGGMRPTQFLPELQEEFPELLAEIVEGRRGVVQVETILRRLDGADLTVDLSMQMPAEAVISGRRCIMAIAHDVTIRKQIETRVATSERFFRATFEDAPLPVFTLDMSDPARRAFVQANDATQEFLGYSQAELAGTSIADYIRADVRPDSAEFESTSALATQRLELPFVRSDGATAWGDLTARRIDVDGAPVRLVHLQDVTRRVEAERERDHREAQLTLLADIRRQVMGDAPLDIVLGQICEAGRKVLDGAAVAIALPGLDETLDLVAGSTEDGRTPSRRTIPIEGSFIGEVYTTRQRGYSTNSPAAGVVGERVGEPMMTAAGIIEGVLIAAPKATAKAFTLTDLDLIAAMANEVAIAVELERARSDRRRLLVVEDRERIARDLHDVVIQRLFAAGMRLQSAIGTSHLDSRVLETITELDDTIRSVRDSIFRLASQPTSIEEDLDQVLDRFRSSTTKVTMTIDGDPAWITASCSPHLVPVVNELVSNAIRHGKADLINVSLRIDRGERVSVRVEDNGSGLDADVSGTGFGIGNLTERAYSLNGSFQLMPGAVDGAVAIWSAPLHAT